MQVDFYHLTVQPLDRVLPRICERIVDGGGRLLIVAAEAEQRGAIDRLLWTYAPDSFLPHAQAEGSDDTGQPVLIAADPIASNAARNIALADGVWRAEALAFDRVFHFFDEERIIDARRAWKGLDDHSDVERRYWKQDDAGRWQQVA